MHGCTQFFYSGTGIIQWFLKGIQVLNLRRSSIMHACYCMLNYDYKCCNIPPRPLGDEVKNALRRRWEKEEERIGANEKSRKKKVEAPIRDSSRKKELSSRA